MWTELLKLSIETLIGLGLDGSSDGFAPTLLQQYFGTTLAEGLRFVGENAARQKADGDDGGATGEDDDSDDGF